MKIRHIILFFVLLGLALGFRLWIIHQAPHSFCISTGRFGAGQVIMPLMGKHILERGELPLFYYGQNWFGSVEAFVHASFFYFFGMNFLTIHFAPLFFFTIFCVSLFLLSHELFGLGVAFWSLAWCIFSPFRLTEYSLMPHGGYIDAPMFGTLLLWMAVRTVRTSGIRNKVLGNMAMGLVGGLGWWASPMMIYYLVTVAVFILIKEQIGGVLRGLICGLPAFLLGAGPFFYYYLHDSSSQILGMGSGFSFKNLGHGLSILFLQRIPGFLDFHMYGALSKGLYAYGAFVYLGTSVFFLWRFRKDILHFLFLRRHKVSDRLIVIVFATCFILIAATSVNIRKSATQYLIPLSPYFAISIGYAACHCFRKLRFLAPAMLIIVFLIQMKVSLAWIRKEAPKTEAMAQQVIKSIKDIEEMGFKRTYVSSNPSSEMLNYYSMERITFANPIGERYDPYFRILESSSDIAFLNPGELDASLKIIGGGFKKERCGKYEIYYGFEEPAHRYRQIDIQGVKIETNPDSLHTDDMKDRHMDSVWESVETKKKNMWVKFDLGKTCPMGLIRLWNKGHEYEDFALDVSIEVSRDGNSWEEVVKRTDGDRYYWSGPRLYYWEWGYRWEARFGPVEARWVRIKQYDDSEKHSWKIDEVYLYEDTGKSTTSYSGERDVLKTVKDLGLKRVYADRWISALVRKEWGDEIETIEPFTKAARKHWNSLKSRTVVWGPETCFIFEDADADSFENMMREFDIKLMRMDFDRWVLFYFSKWTDREEELKQDTSWWWMGLGVVKGYPKNTSEYLRDLGQRKVEAGEWEEALKFYRKALKLYPHHTRARREMVGVLKKLGNTDEAMSEEKRLLEESVPQYDYKVEFENGVEFLGYTLGKSKIRAGDRVKINYYWRLKKHPGEELVVFVHVDGNGQLFQGDHAFLKNVDLTTLFKEEVFREEELIHVPANIPLGKYKIGIGGYQRYAKNRWKIKKTNLKSDGNKVFIGELEVVK